MKIITVPLLCLVCIFSTYRIARAATTTPSSESFEFQGLPKDFSAKYTLRVKVSQEDNDGKKTGWTSITLGSVDLSWHVEMDLAKDNQTPTVHVSARCDGVRAEASDLQLFGKLDPQKMPTAYSFHADVNPDGVVAHTLKVEGANGDFLPTLEKHSQMLSEFILMACPGNSHISLNEGSTWNSWFRSKRMAAKYTLKGVKKDIAEKLALVEITKQSSQTRDWEANCTLSETKLLIDYYSKSSSRRDDGGKTVMEIWLSQTPTTERHL